MPTINEQAVMDVLRNVYDPELGISVVDLNMVKQIKIEGDKVFIDLILTVPGCPLAGLIIQSIQNAVEQIEGVKEVEVKLLDEPWQPPDAEDWQSWLR